jgi:hypothetical protein
VGCNKIFDWVSRLDSICKPYYLAPRLFLGTIAIALDEANKERNSIEI